MNVSKYFNTTVPTRFGFNSCKILKLQSHHLFYTNVGVASSPRYPRHFLSIVPSVRVILIFVTKTVTFGALYIHW